MAKIKFYKLKGKVVGGYKIESISGLDDENKENLLVIKRELLKKECSTRLKAQDIIISSSNTEHEINNENTL